MKYQLFNIVNGQPRGMVQNLHLVDAADAERVAVRYRAKFGEDYGVYVVDGRGYIVGGRVS